MMSFTRAGPISAAKRLRFDIDRQLPSVRAIGKPNFDVVVPMRRSQHAAMPAPPPVQAPADRRDGRHAAASSVPSTRSIRDSYSIASCGVLKARNWLMSVPAANALSPAPVRINTLRARSVLAASQISASRSYIAKVSALRACGRLKVMRPTPPCTS